MNQTDRGNALETEWEGRFAKWSEAFPKDRERWDAAWAGRIAAWDLPEWKPGDELATRDESGDQGAGVAAGKDPHGHVVGQEARPALDIAGQPEHQLGRRGHLDRDGRSHGRSSAAR